MRALSRDEVLHVRNRLVAKRKLSITTPLHYQIADDLFLVSPEVGTACKLYSDAKLKKQFYTNDFDVLTVLKSKIPALKKAIDDDATLKALQLYDLLNNQRIQYLLLQAEEEYLSARKMKGSEEINQLSLSFRKQRSQREEWAFNHKTWVFPSVEIRFESIDSNSQRILLRAKIENTQSLLNGRVVSTGLDVARLLKNFEVAYKNKKGVLARVASSLGAFFSSFPPFSWVSGYKGDALDQMRAKSSDKDKITFLLDHAKNSEDSVSNSVLKNLFAHARSKLIQNAEAKVAAKARVDSEAKPRLPENDITNIDYVFKQINSELQQRQTAATTLQETSPRILGGDTKSVSPLSSSSHSVTAVSEAIPAAEAEKLLSQSVSLSTASDGRRSRSNSQVSTSNISFGFSFARPSYERESPVSNRALDKEAAKIMASGSYLSSIAASSSTSPRLSATDELNAKEKNYRLNLSLDLDLALKPFFEMVRQSDNNSHPHNKDFKQCYIQIEYSLFETGRTYLRVDEEKIEELKKLVCKNDVSFRSQIDWVVRVSGLISKYDKLRKQIANQSDDAILAEEIQKFKLAITISSDFIGEDELGEVVKGIGKAQKQFRLDSIIPSTPSPIIFACQ